MTLLNINLDHLPIIWVGFVASLVSGLATGLGAIPVFFLRTLSAKVQDILLGFSAGIMLSATFFSLILPGLEYAKETVSGNLQAAVIVSGGILLGAVVLWIAHRFAPHEHFVTGKEGLDVAGLRRVWLFVIAITLHNVPEGLSVGVGFSGGDIGNGFYYFKAFLD